MYVHKFVALINYYSKKEAFTPKINQAYRPYFRRARIHYDTFMNYFTKDNVERQTHLCTLTNLRKVTVSVSDPEPYWICVQWPKGDFLLIANVLF